MRRVVFPVLNWVAALLAVAVASLVSDAGIVLAAVGGSWVFILRQWIGSDRAHQVNLLSAIYIAQALGVAAWAAAISLGAPAAVGMGLALAAITWDVARIAMRFEYIGRLPRRYAAVWSWISIRLEKHRASRRERAGVSGFDHGQA